MNKLDKILTIVGSIMGGVIILFIIYIRCKCNNNNNNNNNDTFTSITQDKQVLRNIFYDYLNNNNIELKKYDNIFKTNIIVDNNIYNIELHPSSYSNINIIITNNQINKINLRLFNKDIVDMDIYYPNNDVNKYYDNEYITIGTKENIEKLKKENIEKLKKE